MKIKIKCDSQGGFYLHRSKIEEDYLNEIKRYPILTIEEEQELLWIYKYNTSAKKREEAKQKLIESNLRFVVSIVKKLGDADNFLDLVNEGNMGLMKAIDKYDFSKNCKLITCAVSWIISYIKTYQIKKVKSVIPPDAIRLNNYVKNVSDEFFLKNEREPTRQEIVDLIKEKFNFNITNLEDVELGHMLSINEKYGGNEEKDILENSREYQLKTSNNNVNEDIEKDYQQQQLNYFLSKLNDRERFIVEKNYGIGCVAEGFDTISIQIGLGKERVRQICSEAIAKMSKYIEKTEK